jgi:hypothetical protein
LAAVDADITGSAHAPAEDWDFEKLGLGQPAELDGQALSKTGISKLLWWFAINT